jgi:sulfate adenylyltransferase
VSAPEGYGSESDGGATDLIAPYGGRLVDRVVDPAEVEGLRAEAARLPRIQLSSRVATDLYLLAVGALSPLEGFMDREQYDRVLDDMRLPIGLPWSIPVVLPAPQEEANRLGPGVRAALVSSQGRPVAVIDVTEIYRRDLKRECIEVYGTEDSAHPGVAALARQGELCVAGPVRYLGGAAVAEGVANDEALTPAETRARFHDLGWRSVVAFQTRNPIHRAHEYLQKCALEMVDGLLVHPVVGETKADDIPADLRMTCYRVLLEKYFPQNRVLLSALPLAMRYAGPKEAVFHAIIRRNFGCTHMIVGRDHAGVGDYYGTYDAQRIFDRIDPGELGIRPLNFEHAFWCRLTEQMATAKTSPSSPEDRVFLSGTRVREMLARGERPPVEFTRPEVADVLIAAHRKS